MKFRRKRKAKTRSVWPAWWFAFSLGPIALVVEWFSTPENAYWIAVKYRGLLSFGSVAIGFLIMIISSIRAWRHPKRNLPRLENLIGFVFLILICCIISLVALGPDEFNQHLASTRFNDHVYQLAQINAWSAFGHDLKLYECDRLGMTCRGVCGYPSSPFNEEFEGYSSFALDQAGISVDSETQTISITIDAEPVCTYPE